MKNKKINIQNILARESIYSALLMLMKKKEFSEISITELTVRAGVSRMAFYRNYDRKEDIIIQYLDELFERYIQELKNGEITLKRISLLFFRYMRNQQDLITCIIKENLEYIILERYNFYLNEIYRLNESTDSSIEQKYVLDYVSGGIYKLMIEWVKNGLQESDEKMTRIIMSLATADNKIPKYEI